MSLLTKSEAAQIARVAPSTFDRLVRLGNGPTLTRVGGRVLIDDKDLTAWLAAKRVAPAVTA